MKNFHLYIFLFVALLSACGSNNQSVNVYSSRHYEVDKELYKDFEAKTGIKVNLISADAQALLTRMDEEKNNPQADLFLTVDLPHLSRAKNRGLTEAAKSSILDKVIPANRDSDQHWYAVSSRKRIIAMGKNSSLPVPKSYLDLADPVYKGKILMRSGSSSYNISWIASLIEQYGEETVRTFLKGFVNNFARPAQGNDRKQVSDIYAGKGEVALVNSYYLGRMFHSKDPEEKNAAQSVDLIFPELAHRNISGGALIKNAKHKKEALKLLEYLISQEAQEKIVNANYEFSVNNDVAINPVFTNWGGVSESQDLAEFRWGDKQELAIRLIDESGWK